MLALAITTLIYWPGLNGGYVFDDFPNIVDNPAVQPDSLSLASMSAAALSSPSSALKRPLASLSFAGNYLLTGLDPFWMKVTNLLIHLINGLLVFALTKCLLIHLRTKRSEITRFAALIAFAWLVLPINLTAVLYVVQRMESLAHLFVFAGLLGYCHGRGRMLKGLSGGATLAYLSVIFGTALGLLAKETAILLPLYAALIEFFVFRFQHPDRTYDRRIFAFFMLVLVVPFIPGFIWVLDGALNPGAWSTRDFTMLERLLSETRVVMAYLKWTLLPSLGDLSFYHDDFAISRSLFEPWTTVVATLGIASLIGAIIFLRNRAPHIALGLAMFLGAHSLTATILPLELVYEHRNYFASIGVLIALIPTLAAPAAFTMPARWLLAAMFALWIGLTAFTSWTWRHPVTLAQECSARAQDSPRAQYALAQAYLIASDYDPESPYLEAAWPILERAATLPKASTLPESALIFSAARVGRPIDQNWWDSMILKLKSKPLSQEDQSAVMSLARCARDGLCNLPAERMVETFLAALSHPTPGARALAAYGDYAWNVLMDKPLAFQLAKDAAAAAPSEPEYLITLLKMQLVMGQDVAASETMEKLNEMNIGGRLHKRLRSLTSHQDRQERPDASQHVD